MFVAPFGIVGFAKRVARRFVLIVPRPPKGIDSSGATPEIDPDDLAPSAFESAVPSPTTQGGSP
jgi:hypothetical protein